ncbi:right-handed parallel beta-helix repeat-containing protein [Sphingobacterium haloxyli]|uniref:Right handed beta helix domain-containing protein n=1 Tax=Sphingobacterium haloxyli TaxID=2100533 RepID=A0A2S9J1Z9_9SPHI|nr:right-handed parallel beta-helix repeat-containing protein [Sphingobacterium haloxyli]PRD46805.1 hypothetical protein C5745_13130 [Sphingobacterium haloxyli]
MKRLVILFVLNIAFLFVNAQHFTVKNVPLSTINKHLNKMKYEREYNRYKRAAYPAVKYLPNNYNRSGKADYTMNLQRALDRHQVVLLPNCPVQISDKGLRLKSNQVLLFQPESKLILKPTARGYYDMLQVADVTNVKIFYANLEGDRYGHLGKRGQWGFGISIKSSSNIQLYSPYLKYMWGDGIYIGQLNNVPSKNIEIQNAVIDNVRRNGISITSAIGVDVIDTYIANTNGNSPESGLDIEPNSIHDEIKNINIINLTTYNNKWSGILLVFELFKSEQAKEVSINIDGHFDNGSRKGISFHGYKNDRNTGNLIGQIKLNNVQYTNNQERYYFYNTNLSKLDLQTPEQEVKEKFDKMRKR